MSALRRPLRAGAATVAVATAAALGVAGFAARANTIQEPATVARAAYYTYPATQVTPPLIAAGFPPGTVCLVAGLIGIPQLCGEEVQQVGGTLGLSDGLPLPVTPDSEIAQPVTPGTTPIGMMGGQPRYASALQLALPTLPDGQGFASFELIFHQDGLNFAVESPAFRAMVLGLISQVEEQDPAKLVEDLGAALTENELTTEAVTGVEACPTVEPWAAGDAQDAAADGTRVPDVDCILGTTGTYDEAAGTWTFDLTFAAQAWTEGAPGEDPLANEGILLRPLGAPNLAYGDPDLSTNWVVSLADTSAGATLRPVIRYSTTALPDEVVEVPVDPGTDGLDVPAGDTPTFEPVDSGLGAPSGPQVVNVPGAISARYAERAAHTGAGSLPGWVWLAIPLGLAGVALYGQALVAPADAGRRRPGALSRLVARNEASASPPTRS